MKNLSTSWAEVSLGEICEFKYGKSLPELKRTGGNIPVFGSNGIIGQHNEAITDGSTIVIGRKGSLGKVNFSNVSCWPIDTTYYIDKSATDTDLKWLAYQLSGLGLTKLNKAAAVPGLNREDAYRQRLLLPPLEEQRRIAEVLDRAEELRSKRREAIAQLDTLTQAIFIEMFGDPATNPKGWCVYKLDKLVSEFRYGSSNKSQIRGKPALRIPNIIGGSIDLSDLKLVPVNPSEFERLQLIDGDILFVRTNGNPDFVGRCAVFDSSVTASSGFSSDEFIFASYLIRARLQLDKISPIFFRELMLGSNGRRELRSRSKTSAGQFNINTENLKTVPVFLPPLPLQQEFAHRVEAVEKLKASHRASLSELDALFASLQHRAFRGEL